MTKPKHAGVHVPPPLFFVAAFAAGSLLHRRVPARLLPEDWRSVGVLGGWGLVGVGLLLIGWAMITFLKARTTVMPNRRASRLVRSGPYRYSRNPMYVSLTAIHLGISLLVDSAWPVLFLLPVLGVMQGFIIRNEERYLAAAFGEDYTAYRSEVRRWL